MASGMPSVIDLNVELAKLTMVRRTPHSTREETKGSVARLASYRDGLLLALKSAGTDHWERHLTGDELIHVVDGSTTLEIVCDDGPPKSFTLGAGMLAGCDRQDGDRAVSKSPGSSSSSAGSTTPSSPSSSTSGSASVGTTPSTPSSSSSSSSADATKKDSASGGTSSSSSSSSPSTSPSGSAASGSSSSPSAAQDPAKEEKKQ